jgi:uncharacterized protein (UPF0264 family)
MTIERRHAAFLASVTGPVEARLAVAAGVDVIDCKDPRSGALGGLPVSVVRAVRAEVPRHVPVSATIGDLACEPDVIARPVSEVAATGADYVKIGLFPGSQLKAAIKTVGALDLGECRLVGVMLADREPDFALIKDMAAAGFAGVMLDTAGKVGRTLLECLSVERLREFVRAVHATGLFAGLAGSLRTDQIARLLTLEPDMLGFRGALCKESDRSAGFDADAIEKVRQAIPRPANGRLLRAPARCEVAPA